MQREEVARNIILDSLVMIAIGINRTFLSCNVLESPNEELHRILTLLANFVFTRPADDSHE